MQHSDPWPQNGIRSVPLAAEPLDVAFPVDHPLAARAFVTPAQVIDQPWVTSRAGYSPDDVLQAIAAVTNRPAHVVHRVNDYAVVAEIIAAGGVIGMLPRYTGTTADAAAVVRRPLRGVSTNRMIDVLARPENLRRSSVRLVVEALRRVMSQQIV
jgi:DNA-binding transcriptional LysR family regulator